MSFAIDNDIPVMFVTEDTTRSKPDEIKAVYTRAMELAPTESAFATHAGTSPQTACASCSRSSRTK
ncbi:MAG: hypothetical protein Ct9H300mP30_2860 [Methanobacteriota archaeon]|nr:MAG: hypothetical protein Ct9H300mP30_2860 [Euryarchaeota archaeon]